jgi:uncharacterized protein YdeI (YjbR/CyaY-like superfamily)
MAGGARLMEITQQFYAKNRRAWRAWLAKHHRTAPEIWLVYYRKASGKPRVEYNDAVEEALCYGWIDGQHKGIDDDSWAQRFSPRRRSSSLSPLNRERVRRLIAAGKMTQAGLDGIAHVFDADDDRVTKAQWQVPPDILKRLKEDPVVWRHFQQFSDAYKQIRIGWIDGARRRRAVFETRLRYFMRMTAQNKRFGMVQ